MLSASSPIFQFQNALPKLAFVLSSHNGAGLTVLGLRQNEVQVNGYSKDSLADALAVVTGTPLLGIEVGFEKGESPVECCLIEQVVYEMEDLVDCDVAHGILHEYVLLKELGVHSSVELLHSHLQCEQYHWHTQSHPQLLVFQLDLKELEGFVHNQEHLVLEGWIYLDWAHTSEDLPV